MTSEHVRRWSLIDRGGICHAPLRPNTEDAEWTPILCGGGIALPWSQRLVSEIPVDCKVCLDLLERPSLLLPEPKR